MTGAPDTAVIVGVVIAVLGGVLVFCYLASGSRQRHQCRWSPVGVSSVKTMPFGPVQTAVLQRCNGCGEHQSTTLVGEWTLAQLLGVEAEAGTAAEGIAR
ncbi:hypothetical protein [Nonomuraea cavernae]|uniref:Uncharacterized protein n=1 Tax=Nonomuraea cavernae TaxID=2045107 RepID=A0A918DF26_9ACTN|nr:hypothetical protein [Nonomuraea cavernae]MCA2184682.1 hypothetical protein [Nonomuraea cavernae]GGO63076.1 hypothetical protein GCM10012289_09150 [Nonomuraea cavernae]